VSSQLLRLSGIFFAPASALITSARLLMLLLAGNFMLVLICFGAVILYIISKDILIFSFVSF
jgi:hypothetical protein